jgi:hypothetical protein
MSFQEQLVSNMFDPTNRLVNKMVDSESTKAYNETQLAIQGSDLATRALLYVDNTGRIQVREDDAARSKALAIMDINNVGKAQPAAQQTDIATIVAQAVTAALHAFTQQTATAKP